MNAVRILVTGSSGVVGRWTVPRLLAGGHSVVSYDRAEGQDIGDPAGLAAAATGCEAVVHLAAVLGWHGESDEAFHRVNTIGTTNVLAAATAAGVHRFVFTSSIDVLGVFKGHRPPDRLPLDDDHAVHPNTAYARAKHAGEQACAEARRATGLETVVLRPPGVWEPETYGWITEQRRLRPSFEYDPFWEYGAFVDVRDLASAIERAVTGEDPGGRPFGVAADDLTTSGPSSRAWAERLHPEVPWHGGPEYDTDPHRTLLANHRAKAALSWQPAHRWCDHAGPAPTGPS